VQLLHCRVSQEEEEQEKEQKKTTGKQDE